MSYHAISGPFPWETDDAYARHTIMAIDDTTKLSRAAVAADPVSSLLGTLTEASKALDPDLQMSGETGLFSTNSHQGLYKDGLLTGIASAAITKGDRIGVGATAGQLAPSGVTTYLGYAHTDAAAGEYVAWAFRP